MKIKHIVILAIILIVATIIRTPVVGQAPVSPYWEETILGVDANALAQTGKDHHGTSWPILALESFGDWKPAGYVYALLPFVKVFGLHVWVVRLPSLLAGIAIILAVIMLGRRFGIPDWISGIVAALAPWAIHFSRAGWEAHLATALIAWGMVTAISAIKPKKLEISSAVISILLFISAWYTYHAARLVVPLLAIGLILYLMSMLLEFARTARQPTKSYLTKYAKSSVATLISCTLVLIIGTAPLWLLPDANALTHRFAETGRFSDPSVVLASNSLKELADNSVMARFLYHRYILWSAAIFSAYLDNLNPVFLFVSGESNVRHTTSFFGLFYPFEALFLLVGLYVWLKKRTPLHLLMLYWFGVSIIPAALSIPTPHALRIMIGLPVLTLLISQGVSTILSWLADILQRNSPLSALKTNAKAISVLALISLYVISVGIFWFNYTQVYAKTSAREWQSGYGEMLQALESAEIANPELPVYISRFDGRPASYLWFYRQTDPRDIQAENATALKDQGEYLTFQKYNFVRSASEIPDVDALVAVSPEEFESLQQSREMEQLATASDYAGRIVWIVGRLQL